MIQRLELAHADGLVGIRTSNNGDYVLYTDHLAVIAEKDREISRLRKEADRYRKVSRLRPNAVQMVMRQHLLR